MANIVTLTGRLTKDNDLKFVGDGNIACIKNSIAVTDSYNKEKCDFINIVAWKKTAELMAEYTKKGSKILIEGRISTGKYENKEGKTVYTTDVIAGRVEFLDSKNQDPQPVNNLDTPF